MNILKSIPLLILVAGCASPMTGDFLSTSTMNGTGVAKLVHTSDDENEDGVFEDRAGGSFGVHDSDDNEDGQFESRERSYAVSDTDANEEGMFDGGR